MAIAAVPHPASVSMTESPEQRLLLACARSQPSVETIRQLVETFGPTLNWDDLINTASWHGVLPLLYCNLANAVPHQVPKPIFSRLLKLYLINSAHNQHLTTALEDIARLFAEHDLPVIFFKGPVLAEAVYGSIHLRRFSDLDILVPEQNVSQVRQLLIDNGFQPKRLGEAEKAEDYFSSRVWDDTFIHSSRQVTIDLHWQLMPDYFFVAFNSDEIWARRQTVAMHQVELSSLNPEDLLLYLCTHGSKELWRHLIWICDIAEMVRGYPDLPWPHLLERAQALRIERMFLLGLNLAHELLDMPLPVALQSRIEQSRPLKRLTAECKQRLFPKVPINAESAATGFWLFHNPLHLEMRDRLQDRLPQYWLMLKFFVTPNEEDYQFMKLPKPLSFLYYLVRPIRILDKWGIVRKATFGIFNPP
ncbi:MAG TPA: nucleotidyltransferase family protein [Stenomitos sp.]